MAQSRPTDSARLTDSRGNLVSIDLPGNEEIRLSAARRTHYIERCQRKRERQNCDIPALRSAPIATREPSCKINSYDLAQIKDRFICQSETSLLACSGGAMGAILAGRRAGANHLDDITRKITTDANRALDFAEDYHNSSLTKKPKVDDRATLLSTLKKEYKEIASALRMEAYMNDLISEHNELQSELGRLREAYSGGKAIETPRANDIQRKTERLKQLKAHLERYYITPNNLDGSIDRGAIADARKKLDAFKIYFEELKEKPILRKPIIDFEYNPRTKTYRLFDVNNHRFSELPENARIKVTENATATLKNALARVKRAGGNIKDAIKNLNPALRTAIQSSLNHADDAKPKPGKVKSRFKAPRTPPRVSARLVGRQASQFLTRGVALGVGLKVLGTGLSLVSTESAYAACSVEPIDTYINSPDGCGKKGPLQLSDGVLAFLDLDQQEQDYLLEDNAQVCAFYTELLETTEVTDRFQNPSCNGNKASLEVQNSQGEYVPVELNIRNSGSADWSIQRIAFYPGRAEELSEEYDQEFNQTKIKFPDLSNTGSRSEGERIMRTIDRSSHMISRLRMYAHEFAQCCQSSNQQSCLQDFGSSSRSRSDRSKRRRGSR